MTTSFLTGIKDNPDVPASVSSQAEVKLAGGVPFVSNDQLSQALSDAKVDQTTADAVIDENEQARLDGLRASLAALALISLLSLFLSAHLPTRQPTGGGQPDPKT